jgi:hypothetical protein
VSEGTIRFLLGLLDQVSLPGSHPEFEALAATLVTARRELQAALAALNGTVEEEVLDGVPLDVS